MGINILLTCLLLASSALQEGEELFLNNKPVEALPFLEQALNENPANEKIYLYLGIVYEQINDPERAVQIMRRGLNIAKQYKHLLYYNIANNLFRQEKYTLAEQMYSKAISSQNGFADSFLNRANARLELKNYSESRSDYIQYLRLAPETTQREQIEKLIALLAGVLEAQERQRQDELASQEALLNEVLNSLNNASEDTRNLAADSEEIEEEYEEIDISD